MLDESLREAWLLDLLAQAADTCWQRGVRLMLLVDGLDEDRGVTTGPHAHSIAGLLPGDSQAGMRVIVAGRPNPPVPDDVPDWHPLREPGIIRPLAASPAARDVQRLGRAELKRLAAGTPVEQDLLGLVTAARGGLSGEDLQELAGVGLVDIEDVLHTVAGRTFTCRNQQWGGEAGPLVYLLGHEELDAAARRYLGAPRLAGYRDQLHAWADRYRRPDNDRPAWPVDTPEYLLRGYTRMLTDNRETTRLVGLATDLARHDRMLDLSGGDAAALAEVITAQDLVLAHPDHDLLAMAQLSIRRHDLESRNLGIPPDLPAVWAAIGQSSRAESLANGITESHIKVLALAGIAESVAVSGDLDRACYLTADAEALAHTITDPCWKARVLAGIAEAVAVTGDPDRARHLAADAETIARSVANMLEQARALAEIAGAVAVAGDPDRAESLANGITDPHQKARALAEIARAIAAAGGPDRARHLIADAEALARTNTNVYAQAPALAEIIRAAVSAGDPDRARRLLIDAEAIAHVHTSTDPYGKAYALSRLARAVAAAGDPDRARRLAADAEATAHDCLHPYGKAEGLATFARAVAAAGDPTHAQGLAADAEAIARTIIDSSLQPGALAMIVGAVAATGELDRARNLTAEAQSLANGITDPKEQSRALTNLVRAITTGTPDCARHLAAEAEAITHSITHPYEKARALADMAGVVATAGELDRARRLAKDGEAIARTLTEPSLLVGALVEIAGAVAAADPTFARYLVADLEAIAHKIIHPYGKARALTGLARAAATAGELDRARRLAEDSEAIARTINEPSLFAVALVEIAGAVAASGEPDRAELLANSIIDLGQQARALTAVAGGVGQSVACRLIGRAFAVGSWLVPLPVLAKLRPTLVLQIAAEMNRDKFFSRDSHSLESIGANSSRGDPEALGDNRHYHQHQLTCRGITRTGLSGPAASDRRPGKVTSRADELEPRPSGSDKPEVPTGPDDIG